MPPADLHAAGTMPDGRILVVRTRRPDDVTPDESSPWDDWGPDLLPPDGQPPRYRGIVAVSEEIVGSVTWFPTFYGPSRGSRAWMIGIGLATAARGQGVGTLAQRLLAEALFAITDTHRVEASTDVDNIAEQRSLERAGFTREGIIREAQYRADGRHHDLVVYGVLRGELRG